MPRKLSRAEKRSSQRNTKRKPSDSALAIAKTGQSEQAPPNPEQKLELLREISDPRARFLEWLATPQSERDPRTQRQFAKSFGIHETTLSRWKLDPEFVNKLPDAARMRLLEQTGSVLKKLVEMALSGNLWAIETFLRYVCRWSGKDPAITERANFNIPVFIGEKLAREMRVGLIPIEVASPIEVAPKRTDAAETN